MNADLKDGRWEMGDGRGSQNIERRISNGGEGFLTAQN
jgi:hypothetical protein